MSNSLTDIANAIPQVLMDAIVIQPDTVKMMFKRQPDGSNIKIPKTDKDGNDVMVPGGIDDVSTMLAAFDAIKDMTLPAERLNGSYSYSDIADKAGFAVAEALNTAIDAAIAANDLPDWLDENLSNEGVRFESKLKTRLESLIPSHGFNQILIDNVMAVDVIAKPRFPGLNEGEVDRAIRHRAQGII